MGKNSTDCSVIVCCYNPTVERLKETIISIVKQEDCSVQVVIADDGSKNNYLEEIKEWNSQFEGIEFIYSILPENKGTVINLLCALKLASSEVVKTISPGDYLFSTRTLRDYLDCYKESNADIIIGDVIYYKDFDHLVPDKMPHCFMTYSNRYMARNILVFNDHLHGAGFFVKRQSAIAKLEKIVGRVRLAEDISLVNLALLSNENIQHLSKKVVWYEYGTGISNIKSPNSPMRVDSTALWNYMGEAYDISDITRNRQLYFSDKSLIEKSIIIPGYLGYLVTSMMTITMRMLKYLLRFAFKEKWLKNLRGMITL